MAASAFNRGLALVDVGVGVFLCVIAVKAVVAATFESIVLGVVEFLIGITVGVAALVRFPFLDHFCHALYTYSGRGIVFVLFGTLGLTNGDPIRYIFAGLTIAVGLLYLPLGCFARQTPVQCIDCGAYASPPPKATPLPTTIGPPAAAAPSRPANPWTAPSDHVDRSGAVIVGPKIAAQAPQNPFRAGSDV